MAPALTPKGAATRQRIVVGAARLVRDRSADQVGLDDIRTETATSKSQLFHYFPEGRAELLRAVATHEAEEVLRDQQPFLDELGPAEIWRKWRDAVVAKYEAQGTRCPLAALTRQLAPGDEGTRLIVSGLIERWHRLIADGVRRSQALGVAGPSLVPDDVAAAILAAIQGGAGILLATGRIRFLELALDAALVPLGLPEAA